MISRCVASLRRTAALRRDVRSGIVAGVFLIGLLLPGCQQQPRRERGPVAAQPPPASAAPAQPASAVAALPVDAVGNDMLLVNGEPITVAEVLFPIRAQLRTLLDEPATRSGMTRLEALLGRQIQETIGGVLVYQRASRDLNETQQEIIDKATQKELAALVERDYGGSQVALEDELKAHGLTLDAFRGLTRRNLIIRQYARELLMPRVNVTRDEVLAAVRERQTKAAQAVLPRELMMIEAPAARFLPPGANWRTASPADRAAAMAAAERHIRAAYAALAATPFEDVARSYCRGVQGPLGGSWGEISKPLQGRYAVVSQHIFQLDTEQISLPLQTDDGWYIVKCGRVERPAPVTLEASQDALRRELLEDKFNAAASDYVTRLAESASVVGAEGFLRVALQRALGGAPRAAAR